jgi:hypothetical protein
MDKVCKRPPGPLQKFDFETRVNEAALPADHSPRELARELEQRLLVHSSEVHTESGRHVKVLESWAHWQLAHGSIELPAPAEGRATLQAAVVDWRKPQLPWEAPRQRRD